MGSNRMGWLVVIWRWGLGVLDVYPPKLIYCLPSNVLSIYSA